jgi:ABC-type uncharacterized transport system permease subunit
LRDPHGFGWPQSAPFPNVTMFPILLGGSRLNASILMGIAFTLLAWFLTKYSLLAFKLRVGGAAPDAARYAGFSEKQAVWFSILIGGCAAGLAGLGEVAGPLGQLQKSISPGYGFTAIIVAYLGGLHPLGIVFASFFVAVLAVGGDLARSSANVPYFIIHIMQGVIFVCYLAGQLFVEYRVRLWPQPSNVWARAWTRR